MILSMSGLCGMSEYFMSIMHQCIPQVTVKVKKNPPWLSSVLLTNIRKKNSLYRRARKSGRFEDVGNYKKQRNLVANMLKSKFFDRLNPSDPKSFWKTVKTLSKQSISIPALKDKCGHVASSDVDKAVMLNDFFVQCFNYSVPALDNWSSQDYDLDSSSCPDEFYCSEDEVIDLLTSLNLTKASGSDGISATMLRNTACSIAPAIVMLFNMSISTGKLPSVWKLSAIVPIPKSGDNTNVSNYRPISLLPILSKLLEKHMYAIILHQFEEFSPISVRQWGFQPKKSTTAALLKTFNDWALALDNHKEVCAVFFDIRKAFDSVPHRYLLQKLIDAGINSFILRWVTSYLCGRLQYVIVNGQRSSTSVVVSGVPQGSVLAPLLFLIYVNDIDSLPVSIDTLSSLFADDLLMYRIINTSEDYKELQSDVDIVCNWVDEMKTS